MSVESQRARIFTLLYTNKFTLGFKTVEHSRGQIINKIKLNKQQPACYIFYDKTKFDNTGYKLNFTNMFTFDLLIVTRNAVAETREDEAAKLVDSVVSFLAKNEYYILSFETLISSENFFGGTLKIQCSDTEVVQ